MRLLMRLQRPFSLALTLACLSLTCSACSFISLSRPRTGAKPSEVRAACGGERETWIYPAVDGTWFLLGGLDVYLATKRLEDERDPSTRSLYKVERGFGYVSAIIGGASMIYGIFIDAECSARESRREMSSRDATNRDATNRDATERDPASTHSAARRQQALRNTHPAKFNHPFPYKVLDYEFGFAPAAAKSECQRTKGAWVGPDADGAYQCRKTATDPIVRLSFELGSLTEIDLVYQPSKPHMNRVFDQLEASLVSHYGEPKGRQELDPSCKTSLYACLLSGTEPAKTTWNWSTGSIEIDPRVEGENPALVLRYIHTPSPGP